MPVLQATYDVWTAAMAIDPHARFGVPGQEINEKLGRDADDPRTAVVLDRLRDAGLVDGEGVLGQKNPDDVLVTAKGLQYVAGWPATPDEAAVARLLAVLDQRIQEAPTPEARSNWTRLRDAVSALPREVLADVIAQVVTRAPGKARDPTRADRPRSAAPCPSASAVRKPAHNTQATSVTSPSA